MSRTVLLPAFFLLLCGVTWAKEAKTSLPELKETVVTLFGVALLLHLSWSSKREAFRSGARFADRLVHAFTGVRTARTVRDSQRNVLLCPNARTMPGALSGICFLTDEKTLNEVYPRS